MLRRPVGKSSHPEACLSLVADAHIAGCAAHLLIDEAVLLVHVIDILLVGAIAQHTFILDPVEHPAGTAAPGVGLARGNGLRIGADNAHAGLVTGQIQFQCFCRCLVQGVGTDILTVPGYFGWNSGCYLLSRRLNASQNTRP